MLGFPLLYFRGLGIIMFQLSGFYYNPTIVQEAKLFWSQHRTAKKKGAEAWVPSSRVGDL